MFSPEVNLVFKEQLEWKDFTVIEAMRFSANCAKWIINLSMTKFKARLLRILKNCFLLTWWHIFKTEHNTSSIAGKWCIGSLDWNKQYGEIFFLSNFLSEIGENKKQANWRINIFAVVCY